MLKKAMFLTLALLVGVVAGASAQQCAIGVYADSLGTQSAIAPVRDQGNPNTFIDVYYVLRVEDLVLGAAWYREVTGFNASTYAIDWESYGTFLDNKPEGWRIGLGTCQLGFGGASITLLKETLFLVDDYSGGTGSIQVIPNTLQNATGTAYSDCLGQVKPCGVGSSLTIESVIPAPGKSFGAVKALFE
jgi:hypothetical protein